MQVTFTFLLVTFAVTCFSMPNKKVILEVTPSKKARVLKIAEGSNTTQKTAIDAILEWSLPRFESGQVRISPAQAVETETGS